MNFDTLQSIQRAGTALHEAQTMLTEEVKRQAAQVTDVLTADPFNIASDSQFESWKAVARMAQSLAAMEEQMKKVYYAAADLLGGKRLAQPQLLALAGESTHDVIDEPPATALKKARRTKQPSLAKATGAPPTAKRKLKGNAADALEFFKTRLDSEKFVRVTHHEIVEGASIALGSVGFAISSLKTKGFIAEGDKGHYRLLKA